MNDPLDELLDARLREEASYIDDDGFTARVMQQLPSRPRSIQTQRSLVILGAAILSVIVAYFASGEGMFVHQTFARLTLLPPLQLLILFVICGIAMLGSGVWAALARVRDPLR
jgi:Domain of unknown function (DUF5056)